MNRIAHWIYRVATLAVLVAPLPMFADGPAYSGTKKCRVCHVKEYQSWTLTKMSKAYDLLKPGVSAEAKTKAKLDPKKDYTGDKTCLPCHTTGYGKPGGFVDINSTPDMAGVGCEMCHGAGGAYVKKENMSLENKEYKRAAIVKAGLVAPVSAVQCVGCHNTKSPFFKEFKFEERKTKGTHEKIPLKFKH